MSKNNIRIKKMIISLNDYPAYSKEFRTRLNCVQSRIFQLKSYGKNSESFRERSRWEGMAEELNGLLTRELTRGD